MMYDSKERLYADIFITNEKNDIVYFYDHTEAFKTALIEIIGNDDLKAYFTDLFNAHIRLYDFIKNNFSAEPDITLGFHINPEGEQQWQESETILDSALDHAAFFLDRLNKTHNIRALGSFLNKAEDKKISALRDEFVHLKNLEHLYLNDDAFTDVPPVLYKMPWLKILDLSYNKIRHIKQEISRISDLETLYLQDNNIVGISNDAFDCGMGKLATLDLANNDFDRLPRGMLSNENIKSLNLSGVKSLNLREEGHNLPCALERLWTPDGTLQKIGENERYLDGEVKARRPLTKEKEKNRKRSTLAGFLRRLLQ